MNDLIEAARRRLWLSRSIAHSILPLVAIAVAAGAAAALWRTGFLDERTAIGIPGGAGLLALAAWIVLTIRARPRPEEAAFALDHSAGTKDVFLTALACSREKAPAAMAAVVVAGAHSAANAINPSSALPIRAPRGWYAPPLAAIVALCANYMVPALPGLPGPEAERVSQLIAHLRQASADLESLAAGAIEIENASKELEDAAQRLQELRRSREGTLAELQQLSDRLETRQAAMREATADATRRMGEALARAGMDEAAEAAGRGDVAGALEAAATALEDTAISKEARESLREALREAGLAGATPARARHLEEASARLGLNDRDGAAKALREAARECSAKERAADSIRKAGGECQSTRNSMTGSKGKSAIARKGAPSAGAAAECVSPGNGPVRGRGAGKGSTNLETPGFRGTPGAMSAPAQPSKRGAYERLYEPELLEADGRSVMVEGSTGGPVVRSHDEARSAPGDPRSARRPLAASAAEYRRAAAAAAEYEEIPQADRGYVRDYFSTVTMEEE